MSLRFPDENFNGAAIVNMPMEIDAKRSRLQEKPLGNDCHWLVEQLTELLFVHQETNKNDLALPSSR
jgi:hypothetical protein